jgi:MtrB/PioB family decaheme-associated outer membrane protein
MKAPYRFSFSVLGLSALAAMPVAAAEEPTLESLIRPQSEVEVGVGVVFDDGHRFGMYNGMSDSNVNPLFDASVLHRDDASGTWLRFFGNSNGTEGGQARFEHERQGQWNYFIEGGRATFENPRIIRSPLNGLGSSSNTVGTVSRELDLELQRDKAKIGGGLRLKDEFKVDFSARVERKTGQRQWGAQGFQFATEPIEYTTQEYQGSVSYTGKQLQLQFGYLGSVFTNDAEVLNIIRSPAAAEPQISLPLDNMMHQIYMNGGYSFTPTTRGTFNASYGRLTQDETFFTPATFPGNTRRDLGGEVDNLLLNLGLSSRPIKDLSTRLKFRYEERDDNTPRVQYVTAGTTRDGFNVPFSRETTTADAEADYMLPMNFKLIGGVGYENWHRSAPPIRHASFRTQTDEYTGRIALRRPLLDTLSGSIGYSHSQRTGSRLLGVGSTQTPGINDPILWADRDRDKGRVTLDWAPRSDFSLQFVGEAALDDYTDDRFFGPQEGSYYLVSLDASYKLTDEWDLGGWVAWNETSIEQRIRPAAATPWEGDLRHVGIAVGGSLRGKLTEKLKLGADLQWSEDTSEHRSSALSATAIPASLPDITYRQWLLTLTGDYALKENYGLKLKYGFQHVAADDWTWKGMIYADGSSVRIPDREQTHFVGLSAYFRW